MSAKFKCLRDARLYAAFFVTSSNGFPCLAREKDAVDSEHIFFCTLTEEEVFPKARAYKGRLFSVKIVLPNLVHAYFIRNGVSRRPRETFLRFSSASAKLLELAQTLADLTLHKLGLFRTLLFVFTVEL